MSKLKLILVVLMLGLVSGVSSQPFQGGPPLDGPNRERVKERIKTIKIWKLTEDLNLSSQQSEQFFPIYNAFESDREKIDEKRLDLIRKLDEVTDEENPSEKKISELLDELERLEQQMVTNRIEFRNKLENILTTQQIGKLIVFEAQFVRQIREIIGDVRMEMREKMHRGMQKQK